MIELYHVGKVYPGAERPALDDVNLSIGKGEFVFLSGASGAGKSTLLRLLFCAEHASTGQVLLQGKNLARLGRHETAKVRRTIGVVFQDFKLLPTLSVLDNVALALEVQGKSRDDVVRRCLTVLKEVGLSHKTHQPTAALSGGEQQRVAIARALVVEPAVLLCDEPTGNLDAERAREVMELLMTAHVRGTTVVVATHDPALLSGGRRRVIALDQGTIAHDAPAFGDPAPLRLLRGDAA
ncbi:MAG: cell division ATP-binding protein FtsE [Deltaproteobacteria bacterium]|nr:cell division ATP-binding protein FtsE [Deltaproteobacteria bacterium]